MLRKEWLNGLWAPEGSQGGAGSPPPPANNSTPPANPPANTSAAPTTFEAVMESWTPEVKALYETHTKGLKSALEAERAQNRELAKQAREAAGKAEAGSEAQKAFQALQAKYEALDRKSTFLEESIKPEIGCADSQLAYLAAIEIGAISEKGKVDWATLKERFPLLFRPKTGSASAGAGTGSQPAGKMTMDQYIRGKAGIS